VPSALAKGIDAKYGITGLGEVKCLLGILIEHDCAARAISISQDPFSNQVLARFNDATALSAPPPGTQLSKDDPPTSQEEKDKMVTRLYRELVGCVGHKTRRSICHQLSHLLWPQL
jgi:hypothetical protein